MKNRHTTCLLFAAIILSVSACAGTGTAEQIDAQETKAQTVSAEDENEAKLAQSRKSLPKADFQGYTFTILDRGEENASWFTYDVYAESADGSTINDAVFRRNQMIEEHFNIKIEEAPVKAPADALKTAVTTGEDIYDTFTDGLKYMTPLTTGGYLYQLQNMENLHLDRPWWDPMMTKELSITDKVFFATGDISVMDNDGTWCILFNQSIANDLNFTNLYDMVANGTWTLPAMHGMAKEAASDLNGDGKMAGADDRFGLLTEPFNTYAFWVGAGRRIITKDGDDIPHVFVLDDRDSSAYDAALAIQTDSCSGMPDTKIFETFGDMNRCFSSGRALFLYSSMRVLSALRNSEVNFGILPAPKYDEAQESYCNTYSCYNMTAYGVPSTVSDPGRTGMILESMAELSAYTLTPAYMDISLKEKYTRDRESAQIIDLILNTRSYDLGSIFLQWGDMLSVFLNADSSDTGTFASQYEKQSQRMNKLIERYLEDLASEF